MSFCEQLGHNSLYIYRSEKYLEQNCKEERNKSYPQTCLSLDLAAFEIIKKDL